MSLGRFGTPLLFVAGLCAAIALLEVGLRMSGSLERLFYAAAYINQGYVEVLEISQDPFLRYEARPGASHNYDSTREDWRAGCDLPPGPPVPHSVRINKVGARGAELTTPKTPGLFRILFVGGSTTFGVAVSEEQSLPHQLQQALNKREPKPGNPAKAYEVVNLGLPGYSTGQAARRARNRVEALDADLVLVQIHNGCIRPFLKSDPRAREPALVDDLSLFELYSAPGGEAKGRRASIHYGLLRKSATYASALAAFRILWADRAFADQVPACDFVDREEMQLLKAALEARGGALAYMVVPNGGGVGEDDPSDPFGLRLTVMEPDRECPYYAVHPPASVLAEWATAIAASLETRELLPQ